MTPQELKALVKKTKDVEANQAFLRMPRKMPSGGYGRQVRTPFGLCDTVNADDEHVYFLVKLEQLEDYLSKLEAGEIILDAEERGELPSILH